jgi:hypothetical protein
MSSRITTIALDDQTHAIKKRMGGNFSKFVRECLLRYDAIAYDAICPIERIEGELVGGVCVPAASRVCLIHWPYGRPSREDWLKYRDMINCDPEHLDRYFPYLEDFESPEEWVVHRSKLTNPPLFPIEDIEIEGNAKPKSRKVRRSFISRMLNLL